MKTNTTKTDKDDKGGCCIENPQRQYEIAIEGRRTHYENFEKWMTFYYVAIGAIFVAYYTTIKETLPSTYPLLFSFIGFIISVFWHISCKGFKFWTDNWIRVIWHYEKQLPEEKRVYLLFSKSVRDNEKKYNHFPNHSADISTPKVTLIFSYFICWVWCTIMLYNINREVASYLQTHSCGPVKVDYRLIVIFICVFALFITQLFITFIVRLKYLRNNVDESHLHEVE